MLEFLFLFWLGTPRGRFCAHVLAAMTRLCPCPASDPACPAHHARASAAITLAVESDRDPEGAALLLLAAGAHETGFRTELQVLGPAVSYFQVEVPRAMRPALLADPVAAARWALPIARAGWAAYAGAEGRTADELRRYEMSARWAMAAVR